MPQFNPPTELDISREYVQEYLNTHNTHTTKMWYPLLLWSEGKTDRLTAILENNPPVDDLAAYFDNHHAVQLSVLVKAVEYGKENLINAVMQRMDSTKPQFYHNPSWIFARFPQISAPSVHRAVVKYTTEALAVHGDTFLFKKSLSSYSVGWISEIVRATPRTFEQTKSAIAELSLFLSSVSPRLGPSFTARKNLIAMFGALTAEQQNETRAFGQHKGIDITDVLAPLENAQNKTAPKTLPPKNKNDKVPANITAWEVSQLFNKSRLDDKIVTRLLPYVKPNMINKKHQTLLESVVLQGLTQSFEAVVQTGASVHQTYRQGETLAHKACDSKRKGMLKAVIAAGVNPWQPDNFGVTPLHKVALNCPNMIEILAQHPLCTPNAVDKNGRTALFYVFPQVGRWDYKVKALKAVNDLLKIGVDPSIRDKTGKTFLDVARLKDDSIEQRAFIKTLEDTLIRFQKFTIASAVEQMEEGQGGPSPRKKI